MLGGRTHGTLSRKFLEVLNNVQEYEGVLRSRNVRPTNNKWGVRMWRKGNPFALLVGMQLVQPLWKTVWSYLKKLKNGSICILTQ